MTPTHLRTNLAHDLFFPMLLFGAIGGMTWAVRGSSGFGASAGCIFAGVTLGTAWWFIAREAGGKQTRRYSSGWIILAMTVAFGIAGNRGWMQWPAFWDNRIYIDYSTNTYTYIDRSYGYAWWFIAGVPWAGLGACMIAWCANGRRLAPWLWIVRLAFGFGMCYLLSVVLYDRYPAVFLPLYDSLREQYLASPRGASLWKMIRDNREAMQQLGLYLGFLLFEILRMDWKNVTLISTVGIVNGIGWALLQNWTWAARVWPESNFNYWRCWESTGGVSIGIAFAVAYFLVNRRMSDDNIAEAHALRVGARTPHWTWLPAFVVFAVVLAKLAQEVMPAWNGLSDALANWGMAEPVANWFFPSLCSAVLMTIAIGFGVVYYQKSNAIASPPDLDAAEGPPATARPSVSPWLGAYVLLVAVAGYVALVAVSTWDGLTGVLLGLGTPVLLTNWFVLYLCVIAIMLILIACGSAIHSAVRKITPRMDYAWSVDGPVLERWGAYVGLILGMGISIERGFKGWANIQLGNEHFWDNVGWVFVGSAMTILMIASAVRLLRWHGSAAPEADTFPRAHALVWFVILVQNVIAQLVTAPYTNWNEVAFNIYYVLLFFITAPIIYHFYHVKMHHADVAVGDRICDERTP